MCVIPVVLIQYVTMTQSVYTQHRIIVIQKPTCFGCTKQSSLGFKFQKYIKGKHTTVSVNSTVYSIDGLFHCYIVTLVSTG